MSTQSAQDAPSTNNRYLTQKQADIIAIIRGGALTIDTDGWVTGALHGGGFWGSGADGGHCAMGGMEAWILRERRTHEGMDFWAVRNHQARKVLTKYLEDYHGITEGIPHWNDRRVRSGYEVTAGMRECADLYEMQCVREAAKAETQAYKAKRKAEKKAARAERRELRAWGRTANKLLRASHKAPVTVESTEDEKVAA